HSNAPFRLKWWCSVEVDDDSHGGVVGVGGGGVTMVGMDDGSGGYDDGVVLVVVWSWSQQRWQQGGSGGGTVGQRVGASDIRDRVDRKVGCIFGFAGKRPPEKFSGDGGVVAGGG
nr:hypothetical protein [Tanacetum cinerariifolium]